jgi:hypothetical protein
MLRLNLNQTFTDRVVESYNDLYAKGYRGAVEFTILDPILKKNIRVEVKPDSQVADVKKELLQSRRMARNALVVLLAAMLPFTQSQIAIYPDSTCEFGSKCSNQFCGPA